MDDFFESVFEVVRQIPPGRVTSYGAIAKYLGTARSSRMVGWAMNQSHFCVEYVPAHRVLNRIGLLTGKAHFGSGDEMKKLLEAEGIVVVNDRVQHFDSIFWDPAIEMNL